MEINFALQSESISELAPAFVEVVTQLANARKDRSNPFFKSDYATLESIIEATKIPLASNGFAITQAMLPDDILVTTLLHRSGQWLRSFLPMHPVKKDPQAMGSAVTYGRRYGLAAIVGLTQTDDDGNLATDDMPTLGFNAFLTKVKSEIDNTLTKDVVINLLKSEGFGAWDKENKRAMFEFIKKATGK